MIQDAEVSTAIRKSWETVRIVEAQIDANLNFSLFSLVPAMSGYCVVPESLLLVFAISVLEDALRELVKEGKISCSSAKLKKIMLESKASLLWQDFDTVDEGRELRNRIAHEKKFLEQHDHHKYLNAIENELVAWGILEYRIQGSYKITFGGPQEPQA